MRGGCPDALLPNAPETSAFLDSMILNMPHNPPYHTEISLPELPATDVGILWPTWPEVQHDKRTG